MQRQNSTPKQKTDQGNTELHDLLLRDNIDSHMLDEWIQQNGEEKARKMAKTVNNSDHLPLDLIEENPLKYDDSSEINKLYNLLIPLTIPESFKSLSEHIDAEAIRQEFQPVSNSLLETNLMLGVEAANYARSHIKQSTTHPQMNKASSEELRAVNEQLSIARNKNKDERKNIRAANLNFRFKTKNPRKDGSKKIKSYISDEGYKETVLSEAHRTKEYGVGNCHELAYLAKHHLMENHPELTSAEVFYCKGGDHVFLVIGRGTKSNNYQDWDENAVICDPWSGDVYPATHIPQMMGNYTRRRIPYGEDGKDHLFHIVTFLNENIHSLKPNRSKKDEKYYIKFDENDPLENLLRTRIPEDFTAEQMVVLHSEIIPNIRAALRNKQIEIADIEGLSDPIPTLYFIFNNEYGRNGLNLSLFKFNDIARLPKTVLTQLLSAEGIEFLKQIKHLRNQTGEMSQEWLNAVLTSKWIHGKQRITATSSSIKTAASRSKLTPEAASFEEKKKETMDKFRNQTIDASKDQQLSVEEVKRFEKIKKESSTTIINKELHPSQVKWIPATTKTKERATNLLPTLDKSEKDGKREQANSSVKNTTSNQGSESQDVDGKQDRLFTSRHRHI
jgi:hypothetical protein